jgi:tetratricopeptide (TPR) repeat protein
LAAGGISIPGVAYSLWILMALAINQTRGALATADELQNTANSMASATAKNSSTAKSLTPAKSQTPWGSIAGMATAGSLATACYLTAYGPVLRSTAAMYRVQSEEERLTAGSAERRDPRRRELALIEAEQADPLASQTWQLLADLDFQRVSRHGSGKEEREQFDRAVRTMLRLRPQSSGAYRQAGEWSLELFRQHGDPQDGRQAIEFFGQAAELYPNSAGAHADYAFALATVGKPAEARGEARRAQELDAAMPHADKKLSAAITARLETISSPDQSR